MRQSIVCFVLCLIGLNFPAFANSSIGKIIFLKGSSHIDRGGQRIEAHKDGDIFEGDHLQTEASTLIKVQLVDDTIIQLGPEASFKFTDLLNDAGNREAIFELVKGKLRAVINKKAGEGESIKFNSSSVALGVRGTEFLTNVYSVAGKSQADVVLLKGKLAANIEALGIPVKNFDVEPGQYFNTHQIAKDKALDSVKSLSQEALKNLLENAESFLPDLMDASGVMQNLGSLFGAAAALASGSSEEENKVQAAPTILHTEKETVKEVTVIYKEKEAPDPMDIQDAKERKDAMRSDGKCFYWFYKVIPGAFNKERFRRERDCEDYEFELEL